MPHGIKSNILTVGSRAINLAATAVIGLIATADDADNTMFPMNVPVLITDVRKASGSAGTSGTLKPALDAIADQASPVVVVIRVAASTVAATQATAVIGGVTNGVYTGAQALLLAEAVTGVRPRILAAPGLDTQTVTAALVVIAKKLRAMVYASAVGTKVSDVLTYAASFSDRELMLIWPNFTGGFAGDAVARAVGLRALIDEEQGWHKSISNVPVGGVTGISSHVYFDIQDATSDAGLLNDAKVTTLIRSSGFRFWGNRTTASETQFSFEPAVRTSQVLQDSIADGLAWAIDRPLTAGLVRDVIETVNGTFRALVAQGRLIGARAWYDPALNSQTDLSAGKLVIDYDFTPAAPLEYLTLNQRITDRYYSGFADQLA